MLIYLPEHYLSNILISHVHGGVNLPAYIKCSRTYIPLIFCEEIKM